MGAEEPARRKAQGGRKRGADALAAKPSRRASGVVSSPSIQLKPIAVYEFAAGDLTGYLRLADPNRGFEFCGSPGGASLPTDCREVLSPRHYLARGNGGLLAPREEAACRGKVQRNGIVFTYDPVPGWPVETTVRYELLPGGIDATLTFGFGKDLAGFEVGVETLVARARAGIHVHSGGRWVTPTVGPRLKRFYPRNLGAAELIADGRWGGLRRAGVGLAVEPQGYDYPVIVAWQANPGWALVWMALTEQCSSVWLNGLDKTVGMGLIGANVAEGSSCTCRVRAVLRRASSLDEVLPHYREFVQAARTTRRR